jgi:conjugative transposon TraJ protein
MKYKPLYKYSCAGVIVMLLPFASLAQTSGGVQRLHTVLENLYKEMVPLCEPLIDTARAIAGFGALFYIAYRVWKHIANAEAIDFFPLLRPFCIAMVITFYPTVLGVMNGILKPMATTTNEMVKNSNKGVERLLAARAKNIVNSNEWEGVFGGIGYNDNKDWYKYQQPEGDNQQNDLSPGRAFKFSLSILANTVFFLVKILLSYFLQILYYAAALCIDAMRTFHLLILAILGPLVLCLAAYDGFQHILPVWIGRYINIYLWLPIANIMGTMLGKIQQGMLKLDIAQTNSGDLIGFGPTDIAYLIFLVVAILGYFSIPSIANYIIHASGANTLMTKTNRLVAAGKSFAMAAMTSGAGSGMSGGSGGGGSMSRDIPGNDKYMYPMADAANSEPYMKDSYQQNKLSGKS